MTINEIMKAALAFCGESSPAPYISGFGVHWANALLAENFETEQNIRRAEGKELLEKVPVLKLLSDEIPYSEELVSPAFVFGFASIISDVGGDRELASLFRSRYLLAAQTAAKGFEHAIIDNYGEERYV